MTTVSLTTPVPNRNPQGVPGENQPNASVSGRLKT